MINPGSMRPDGMVPKLSSGVSVAQHSIHSEAVVALNAPLDPYDHKPNWCQIAKPYQTKVAHARLIKDAYGASSTVTCDCCPNKVSHAGYITLI
jgi:hypothetical protein